MTDLDACAIAVGAVSGLGLGAEAYRGGPAGSAPRVAIARDAALEAAGLGRPFAARAPADLGVAASGDRATDLLRAALSQVCVALDAARPGWRRERVGVALGTSSGGMLTAERFYAARAGGALDSWDAEQASGATYFAPMAAALAAEGLHDVAPRTQILAACAASTIALGLALRWLERGAADLVLAGGYDGVSVFVASGFEVLRATTATSPRPFRAGRDGMSLGEGAAILALTRGDNTRGAPVLARIAGFGASNDATHITAPDRTGGGLARAASAALADAACPPARVDLVSAHGTATPFNDAMEARAIDAATGGARPVVHAFKAQIGHTLGAAGVLEALAAADALTSGVAPATAGGGAPLDPDASACLIERAEARPLRAALKLSAAFGGSDAALVLAHPAAPSGRAARPRRAVHVAGWARVVDADLASLAEATGIARDRLARLDRLCRLGLAAVAALASELSTEALRGAGIVAGQALATLDTNDAYAAQLRARGPTGAPPRVFPATSPNALVGECAIAFRLTGPSFAVGAGLDAGMEAIADARELCAAGDADRVVVVAADDAGDASRALLEAMGLSRRALARGAVALLLAVDTGGREVPLDVAPAQNGDGPIGHLSVVRWLEG